jgi:hypothetical protein
LFGIGGCLAHDGFDRATLKSLRFFAGGFDEHQRGFVLIALQTDGVAILRHGMKGKFKVGGQPAAEHTTDYGRVGV